MTTCDTMRDWLPWYVSGRLAPERLERMSAHIAECPTCHAELAQMISLRNTYASAVSRDDVPVDRVWTRLSERLSSRPSARIDVGSFLVGLQIGIASRGRHAAIDRRVSILGHTVRIHGKRTKGA